MITGVEPQRSAIPLLGETLGVDPVLGRVVAVRGSVVDIAFRAGDLPAINEAVAIQWDLGSPLVAKVQQHLGPTTVRVVALGGTAGLRRGTGARALGAPVRAPVGKAVLGRLLATRSSSSAAAARRRSPSEVGCRFGCSRWRLVPMVCSRRYAV